MQNRLSELGRTLFDLKKTKAEYEEKIKNLDAEITRISQVELPKLMEDGQIPKFAIEGLGTVFISNEFYSNVLKDDRPKLHEWMRENGFGDIIQEYIFPQTLTAFVREQISKNNPLPPVVKVSHVPTAKTRRQ